MIVYSAPHELTSPQWAEAFAAGHGAARIVGDNRDAEGPMAMFGSPYTWSALQRGIDAGREWFYGDHAYFGRGEFYRCTRGRYQVDVRAAAARATPRRFERLPTRPRIESWRAGGRHVLLCLQSDAFYRMRGIPEWPSDVAAEIAKLTDREVRVRTKATTWSLRMDLRRAAVVVSYSSMCSVHAALAGVPSITIDPNAVGAAFGTTDLREIENPRRSHEREALAWALADHQWTLDEYRRGVAWRNMQ